MKVLITAGSTWAKVDRVRIFTSCFSGKTGLYLAKALAKKGYQVTLLLNPHAVGKVSRVSGVKIIYFYYFQELKQKLEESLTRQKYRAIIHSAAVNDYLAKKPLNSKIKSGGKNLKLELKPAPKLIKRIRKLSPDSLVFQFKLEAGSKGIIDKAYRSLQSNRADFVIANSFSDLASGYKACIIDAQKGKLFIFSRRQLAKAVDLAIKKTA